MRYFDYKKKRLIYLARQATPAFWDDRWETNGFSKEKLLNIKDTIVVRLTKKYLKPEEGPILEGGCGTGVHVAALTNNRYQCIGVDYAPNTVRTLNEILPELDIRLGDVRYLPFADASFAGYWSLGVIEHFWDGYEAIAAEMARVLRPEGYLFLSFPYLSPLRKVKALSSLYPQWTDEQAPPAFYQFALDHRRVIEDFRRMGFSLVGATPQLGMTGAEQEIPSLKSFLQKLRKYREASLLVRGLIGGLSYTLTLFTGHVVLLVFRRRAALSSV
ncbi:MAG: class I SAM-dependent methyltransferase [Candidatus Caldarchaeum sp.]